MQYVKKVNYKQYDPAIQEYEIFVELTKLGYDTYKEMKDQDKIVMMTKPDFYVNKHTYTYTVRKKPNLDKIEKIIDDNLRNVSVGNPMTVAQYLKGIKDKGYKVVKNPSGSITITKIKAPVKK